MRGGDRDSKRWRQRQTERNRVTETETLSEIELVLRH